MYRLEGLTPYPVMIANAERTVLISSMGWVDRDTLWVYDVPARKESRVPLGSGAKYLSLHSSGPSHFAVGHHFDGTRFEITVHLFSEPKQPVAQGVITEADAELSGEPNIWNQVPRLYVDYLRFAPWGDFVLLLISPSTGRIEAQRLEWYDDSYDKGYQGVVDVLEIPGEGSALVSVQRSSQLVMHDLTTGKKKRSLNLAGRGGNPSLYFRASADEIWASDYDTMVAVDKKNWEVTRRARLQQAWTGTQQFIGDYSFAPHEETCVVARPFSSDVVGIDPSSLKIKRRAKLGKQPLEVAFLASEEVLARDWKTGEVLYGKLERCWFAG
ncbi:MAG: hypothetical protein HYV04_13165 [Deltaproteobacteria bacterium]|nr:hypothetical protein [Deltaproteobacteria bacterium]